MNTSADAPILRGIRPAPERTGPIRTAGGMYRTSDDNARAIAGVPLVNAEDAVLAAVRMGYRVAEVQIERADRLATRLRSAGERALGPEPENQAIDATEKLVTRAVLTGIGWLEGVGAEPGSPWRRLALAEYRLLGALFGLRPEGETGAPAPSPPAPAPAPAPVGRGAASATVRRPAVLVKHIGTTRRRVKVAAADLPAGGAGQRFKLVFFHDLQPEAPPIEGELSWQAGAAAPMLAVETAPAHPPGRWVAPICDGDAIQVGELEIEL